MNRITITVPPAVSQLLKDKTNRSHYISELIIKDAYESQKDTLVERTKKALLSDDNFIRQLKNRSSRPLDERGGVTLTGPEDYA